MNKVNKSKQRRLNKEVNRFIKIAKYCQRRGKWPDIVLTVYLPKGSQSLRIGNK